MSTTLKTAIQQAPGYFWLGEPLIVYQDNKRVWSRTLDYDIDEDGLPAARVWIRTDGQNAAYNGEYTVIFSIDPELTRKIFPNNKSVPEITQQIIESVVLIMTEDVTAWGQTGNKEIQEAILEADKKGKIYVSYSPDCVIDECSAGEELTYST